MKKAKLLWGYVNRATGNVVQVFAHAHRAELRRSCPERCMLKRVRPHGTGYRIVGKG